LKHKGAASDLLGIWPLVAAVQLRPGSPPLAGIRELRPDIGTRQGAVTGIDRSAVQEREINSFSGPYRELSSSLCILYIQRTSGDQSNLGGTASGDDTGLCRHHERDDKSVLQARDELQRHLDLALDPLDPPQ
jgi:hypothetical protein